VKIYVAAVEALRKKEGKTGSKLDEKNSVWHKKLVISEFEPPLKANVLVCMFLYKEKRNLKLTPRL
jgi:hypothetical protein